MIVSTFDHKFNRTKFDLYYNSLKLLAKVLIKDFKLYI